MSPDRFRALLTIIRRTFNAPPRDVPRDAMWARIRLARDFNRMQEEVPRDTMWHRLLALRIQHGSWRTRRVARAADIHVKEHLSGAPRRRALRGWLGLSGALAAAAALLVLRANDVQHTVSSGVAASDAGARELAGDRPTQYGAASEQFAFGDPGDAAYLRTVAPPMGSWLTLAADDPVSEAYRRAATLHIRRVDSFIATFRSSQDNSFDKVRTNARTLLSSTRLLLDSPAAIKVQYRKVFEDLELILVKISVITPETAKSDREQIERTLERKNLVGRMRDLLPAPASSNAN